jgi:hypothetical protein
MNREETDRYSDRDLIILLLTKMDTVCSTQDDHEKRLRDEEKASSELRGSITGIKWVGGFITFIIGILGAWIGFRGK